MLADGGKDEGEPRLISLSSVGKATTRDLRFSRIVGLMSAVMASGGRLGSAQKGEMTVSTCGTHETKACAPRVMMAFSCAVQERGFSPPSPLILRGDE
jgi:hypothetical protein